MSGIHFPTAAETARQESLAAAGIALAETRKPAVLALVPALPKTPEGWRKAMKMHLNMGKAGHSGVYEVFDAAGKPTPIGYQYHTKDAGLTGFTLPGIDGVMTWSALREAWPGWLASRNAKATP